MGAKHYEYITTNCAGGINQNPNSIWQNQCADALNVYAPNGVVIQRPGYVGKTLLVGGSTFVATVFSARAEDNSGATPSYTAPGGTGLLDLSGLVAERDRWYLGHTTTFGAAMLRASQTNSNTTHVLAEYYNDSTWRRLEHTEISLALAARSHLSRATGYFYFVPPDDWAETTVDSLSRYWIRFWLLDADLDASTEIDVDNASFTQLATVSAASRGIFVANFPTTKRILAITHAANDAYISYVNLADFDYVGGTQHNETALTGVYRVTGPASIAVVPQFEEAYVTYGGHATVHGAHPTNGDSIVASVEDRDFAIGPGAPWDKDTVSQLADFPRAKFIDFWNNRLFVVDEDDNLRWSAATPYHRVWPSLAYAPLIESDDSPVSGMRSLFDAMIVYKNDSIWAATFAGLDAFEIPQYAVRKMPGGIGCVANNTIQEIRGTHVFLSEDGIQQFDGISTRKISEQRIRGQVIDRLKDIWPRITAGKRVFAASAHWRQKQLYILSVPVDGSETNNLTIVWDYGSDTLWLWDNIAAQFWLSDEDANDEETLYFGDSSGRIYRFGVGDEDNFGAIESYVVTRRLGWLEGKRDVDTLREVEITSRNSTDALDIRVARNGTPMQHAPAAATLDFSDYNETIYGDTMGSAFSWIMERSRSLFHRVAAHYVQVKVGTQRKGRPFYMSSLRAGFHRLRR